MRARGQAMVEYAILTVMAVLLVLFGLWSREGRGASVVSMLVDALACHFDSWMWLLSMSIL